MEEINAIILDLVECAKEWICAGASNYATYEHIADVIKESYNYPDYFLNAGKVMEALEDSGWKLDEPFS